MVSYLGKNVDNSVILGFGCRARLCIYSGLNVEYGVMFGFECTSVDYGTLVVLSGAHY